MRTRNGVIIDFVSALEVIRQGVFESRIYAVVLDSDVHQLSYKLLNGLRLVRPRAEPLPQQAEPSQDRERSVVVEAKA